jgi:hypothetical protein
MKEVTKNDYNDMIKQIYETNNESEEFFRKVIYDKTHSNDRLIAKCDLKDLYEYCINCSAHSNMDLFAEMRNKIEVGVYVSIEEALDRNRDELDSLERFTKFIAFIKNTYEKGEIL